MKIVVFGDSDIVFGFCFVGVYEVYVFEEILLDIERFKNKFNEFIEREDVGIILIIERLVEKVEIFDVKFFIIF